MNRYTVIVNGVVDVNASLQAFEKALNTWKEDKKAVDSFIERKEQLQSNKKPLFSKEELVLKVREVVQNTNGKLTMEFIRHSVVNSLIGNDPLRYSKAMEEVKEFLAEQKAAGNIIVPVGRNNEGVKVHI